MDNGINLGTTFSVIAVHGKVSLSEAYPPSIYLEKCGVARARKILEGLRR